MLVAAQLYMIVLVLRSRSVAVCHHDGGGHSATGWPQRSAVPAAEPAILGVQLGLAEGAASADQPSHQRQWYALCMSFMCAACFSRVWQGAGIRLEAIMVGSFGATGGFGCMRRHGVCALCVQGAGPPQHAEGGDHQVRNLVLAIPCSRQSSMHCTSSIAMVAGAAAEASDNTTRCFRLNHDGDLSPLAGLSALRRCCTLTALCQPHEDCTALVSDRFWI